jgi:cytochrome c553
MSKASAWLSVLLALGGALLPLPGHAQPMQTLKSASIDLPQGNFQFPPGPGSDAITNNCLACHSAGMVLNQPRLPKATWEAEVHKMINIYKAPVAPEDIQAIVAYLVATKGTDAAGAQNRRTE